MKLIKKREWTEIDRYVAYDEQQPEDPLNPHTLIIRTLLLSRNKHYSFYGPDGDLIREWKIGPTASKYYLCPQTGRRSKQKNICKNEGWVLVDGE